MQSNQKLYEKLGPQGRAILNPSSSTYRDPNFRVPTQLDYLLDELSHPTQNTTLEKALSYLAYYYPKLKNQENVRLLTSHFLSSPLLQENANQDNFSRIVDFYSYVITHKYKISVPTLPFTQFYHYVMLGITENGLNPNCLPVISGCLLSKPIRAQYGDYPIQNGHIKTVDNELLMIFQNLMLQNIQNVSLLESNLCLLAFLNDFLDDKFIRKLLIVVPELSRDMIPFMYQSPLGIKNLSRLSSLYSRIVTFHPDLDINLKNIDWNLVQVQSFTQELVTSYPSSEQQWTTYKSMLFSFVIVFESIASLMLSLNSRVLDKKWFVRYSRVILQNLFNVSFILDKIGSGGFQSYNFVYFSCIGCLSQNDKISLGDLTDYWFSQIRFGIPLHESPVEQSKLLFILNFMDNAEPLPQHDKHLSMVDELILNPVNQQILEAAHAVMLKHLPNSNPSRLLDYAKLAISQFPDKLALHQVKIILESLTKKVSPDVTESAIDPMTFNELFVTPLLQFVLSQNNNRLLGLPKPYEHRKAALCSSLIKLTVYVPIENYLDFMKSLKTLIVDDLLICTIDERNALLGDIYDSLLLTNKFFPQKGMIGFQWWYGEVERAHL
ncbi:unnamed protein product [Ambrosiozyma monospora]|uniref:Unnamed protein product n=1 Tax=Ambrosiozyma monospora TaxID=43982 RepID=A0A9W6Z116_AMBMO|nr:unnamed protein product [Ambrosiozyma monospora]